MKLSQSPGPDVNASKDATNSTEDLKAAVLQEALKALRTGLVYALALMLGVGLLLFVLMALSNYSWRAMLPSLAFVGVICVVTGGFYAGLRGGIFSRRGVYLALILLSCAPSGFFLATHFTLETGAATYFLGPIATLYFVILVLTGFFFDIRLSTLAGAAAASSFALVYFVARPVLVALPIPVVTMHGVVSAVVPNLMKSVMILITGFSVGLVARYSLSIVSRMLAEQKAKGEIDRLFGEYVSEEVRERIKSNPLAIGERKQMAIMFTDLRGFTRLSERAAPEEIVNRLNLYFDEMVAAISAHGGVVDKFIGDAILATFGGLVDIKNPCAAAYRAAADMQLRMRALNQKWSLADQTELKHGIGLHYAQVLQGAIGSRSRKDYTVIGDGVNLTSRVESLTKKLNDAVLVTSEFYDELPPEFQAAACSRRRVRVRGREGVLEVYGFDFEAVGSEKT